VRHRSFEQVATLRQGLDHALRLIADRQPDIADAAGQRFLGDGDIWPNGRDQFILGDGLSGALGKIAQHFEAFRPQLYFTGRPKQAKPLQIKRQKAENQFHILILPEQPLRRQREVSG
jgi:hypothetical protein